MNYTLSFQQQWPPQQLVRSGGEHDPLERKLRIVTADQYRSAVVNPGKKTLKIYDFRLDMDGDIMPRWSPGFSTYTDKVYLPVHFQERPERLWRIECGVMQMYPAEMELKLKGEHHYVIKPMASVTPETLRRMLRCLPWVKLA